MQENRSDIGPETPLRLHLGRPVTRTRSCVASPLYFMRVLLLCMVHKQRTFEAGNIDCNIQQKTIVTISGDATINPLAAD